MAIKIKTGVSTNPDPVLAVKDVSGQIRQEGAKLAIFFFSMIYDAGKLLQAFSRELPGVKLCGCSTAGEITPKGFLTKSLTAMSIASGQFDAGVGIAAGLSADPQKAAGEAFRQALQDLGAGQESLDPKTHLVMVLPDGMSGKEETFVAGLNEIAPDLSVVGGSAGDDLQFKQTLVCGQNQTLSDAAAVVLIRTTHPWTLLKTSSYKPAGRNFIITRADPDRRIINTLDGKPAVEAYAEAIRVPREKVADHFMDHPLAVDLPDGYYNRSPQQAVGDAIKFYCNIAEGVSVSLMEPGDVKANLADAMGKVKTALNGKVAGFLAFNCILRYLEAENKKISPELFRVLNIAPVIGFETYGEQFNTLHINQTLTLLAFGG